MEIKITKPEPGGSALFVLDMPDGVMFETTARQFYKRTGLVDSSGAHTVFHYPQIGNATRAALCKLSEYTEVRAVYDIKSIELVEREPKK